MRRSCEAAATSWRRAVLDLAPRALLHRQADRERRRQRRAGGGEQDQQDLVGAHVAGDGDRGGAGQEGGDGDDDGTLHGRNR